MASGIKKLNYKKDVTLCQNPLRYLAKYNLLMEEVSFIGYEAAFTLKENEN